jgi:Cu2+-exporting ATPase
MKLVTALDLARNGVELIHQNYAIVVGLNILALAMAMLGGAAIPPELTALISNGSAVTASLNGLRPLID